MPRIAKARAKKTSRAKAREAELPAPYLDFDIWQMGQMNKAADAKLVLRNASDQACQALEMLAVIHSMLDEGEIDGVYESVASLRGSIRTFEVNMGLSE